MCEGQYLFVNGTFKMLEQFTFFQQVFKNTRWKKVKPPADVTESERSSLCKHKADSGRNYAGA